MAVVVGLIRAVDVTSTKVTYTLDDTTAVMDVVQWIESDSVSYITYLAVKSTLILECMILRLLEL